MNTNMNVSLSNSKSAYQSDVLGIPEGILDNKPDVYLNTNRTISGFGNQTTIALNLNQSIIYYALSILNGEPTTKPTLAKETEINKHTVDSIIKKLKSLEIIVTERVNINGALWGFKSIILRDDVYFAGDENTFKKRVIKLDRERLTPQTLHRLIHLTEHGILVDSSSFNKNTTSIPEQVSSEIERMLSEAEFEFWVKLNLRPTLIWNWMTLHGFTLEAIFDALRYVRWDYLHEKRKIRNPISYVFGALRDYGAYVKPANYQSLADIERQKMEVQTKNEASLRKMEHKAQKQAAIDQEIDKLYFLALHNEDQEVYKRLLHEIPEATRAVVVRKADSSIGICTMREIILNLLDKGVLMKSDDKLSLSQSS